ncbi:MAG: glycosyltransferase family 9 protein, partial [Dehalococcoidia bacterium]
YLEVAALVGAETPCIDPYLTVTQADLDEARAVLPASAKPLAVLHPGAMSARRRWPSEQFAQVGDALAGAGAEVAVIGTEPELDVVAAVCNAMQSPAHCLCGKLSLRGLIGLLSQAAVVVSNDSGPLHLAGAVGASTVGIYWCGNLFNGGPITQARHRTAASWRLECPVCGVHCLQSECTHDASFVADIPTSEVIEQALELLSSYPSPAHSL